MQDDPLGVAQFSALGLVELSEVTMTLPLQVSAERPRLLLAWTAFYNHGSRPRCFPL